MRSTVRLFAMALICLVTPDAALAGWLVNSATIAICLTLACMLKPGIITVIRELVQTEVRSAMAGLFWQPHAEEARRTVVAVVGEALVDRRVRRTSGVLRSWSGTPSQCVRGLGLEARRPPLGGEAPGGHPRSPECPERSFFGSSRQHVGTFVQGTSQGHGPSLQVCRHGRETAQGGQT